MGALCKPGLHGGGELQAYNCKRQEMPASQSRPESGMLAFRLSRPHFPRIDAAAPIYACPSPALFTVYFGLTLNWNGFTAQEASALMVEETNS